jgi:uncharacterized phage protein (TIGR02218 family)
VSGAALQAHLEGGATTLCRCWSVARRDGAVLGFTDHDRALVFEGVAFSPEEGMSAAAIEAGTGLAVDNSEAVGVLGGEGLTEADILAGRLDGAAVTCWLVNWADPAQRRVLFRGSLGEVRREAGAFHAELRGLAEALNQPLGRVIQAPCAAVLGDADCGVDLGAVAYSVELAAQAVEGRQRFTFAGLEDFAPGWFEKGRLRVLEGAAAGLVAVVKNDREGAAGREIETWEALGAEVAPGDALRLEAGCDKRVGTCREKFANLLNFRGFPHVPGEDWLISYPVAGQGHDGGSRQS